MKVFVFSGKVKDLRRYLMEWSLSLENNNK